ncbi:DOCK family protein, partial [Reticulomyxa filosa]
MVEAFEMIIEYDGDGEAEFDVNKSKDKPLGNKTEHKRDQLKPSKTMEASTPSPLPSDDESDATGSSNKVERKTPTPVPITIQPSTSASTPTETKAKKKIPATPKDDYTAEPIQGKLFDDVKDPVKPKEVKKKEDKPKGGLKEPTNTPSIATSVSNPSPKFPKGFIIYLFIYIYMYVYIYVYAYYTYVSKSANTSPRKSNIETKKKTSQQLGASPSRASASAAALDTGAALQSRRAKTSFGVTQKKSAIDNNNSNNTNDNNNNNNNNNDDKKKNRHRDRNTKKGKKIIEGDKVLVQNKYAAIIRYIGRDEAKKDAIYGVELLDKDAVGEHNGTVDGKTYFSCPDKKGLLVTKKDFKPLRDVPVHNQQKYN